MMLQALWENTGYQSTHTQICTACHTNTHEYWLNLLKEKGPRTLVRHILKFPNLYSSHKVSGYTTFPTQNRKDMNIFTKEYC